MKKILLIIGIILFTLNVTAKEYPKSKEKSVDKIKTEMEKFKQEHEATFVMFMIYALEETELFKDIDFEQIYYEVYGELYELPIIPEEWMYKPFDIQNSEDSLEIEDWMTKPFTNNLEEALVLEHWMLEPLG